MAEPDPELTMVKAFCGLDATADTNVLEMCYKAAVEWYRKAGVPKPAALSETATAEEQSYTDGYQFWLCNLTAYFYDNRGAMGDNAKLPPYILGSLHQLRPVTTEETTL